METKQHHSIELTPFDPQKKFINVDNFEAAIFLQFCVGNLNHFTFYVLRLCFLWWTSWQCSACNWRSLCPAACWSSSTGRSQSRQDGSCPRTGSRCRRHHLFFFARFSIRNSSLSQICGELNHFGKIRRLLKSWSRQQQQMETRFLEMTRCPIDWLMWTSN